MKKTVITPPAVAEPDADLIEEIRLLAREYVGREGITVTEFGRRIECAQQTASQFLAGPRPGRPMALKPEALNRLVAVLREAGIMVPSLRRNLRPRKAKAGAEPRRGRRVGWKGAPAE